MFILPRELNCKVSLLNKIKYKFQIFEDDEHEDYSITKNNSILDTCRHLNVKNYSTLMIYKEDRNRTGAS